MEKEIEDKLFEIRYRQKLILSALRNILQQDNTNGVNNYLIRSIEREI